jgi:hypothetical protein
MITALPAQTLILTPQKGLQGKDIPPHYSMAGKRGYEGWTFFLFPDLPARSNQETDRSTGYSLPVRKEVVI